MVLDSTSVLCSCSLTPNFLPVSPAYVLSKLAQGTLYTHSVMSSLSCLSFGCTNKSFNVLQGFMATGTLCFFHNFHYGFRNFGITIIGLFTEASCFLFFFFLLLTLNSHLTSNFTERPWGIAASPQSLFYLSTFLYFVLTGCDQLLTSFHEGPYHT